MALTLITAPTVEPVTLAEVKSHLRVHVDDENDVIRDFCLAAREHVESFTRRALLTQTWDLQLDTFPAGVIELPIAPVQSITSITYLDSSSGASQTWASSDYRADLPVGPRAPRARIEPDFGEVYPSTYGVLNAVTVRFVAGYGSLGASVPRSLRSAIKLLVEFWYRKGDGGKALTPAQIEERLLWPFRSY